MKTLTKEQYLNKKEFIINTAKVVKTSAKTSRRKQEHRTTIKSEIGTVILEILGCTTSYYFKD